MNGSAQFGDSTTTATQRVRIFISYKRDVPRDEDIVLEIYKALSQKHDVFIDRTMHLGDIWAKRIEEELHRADFVIVFLSNFAIDSEMIRYEIKIAHSLYKERRHERPVIIPVRLDYRDRFPYHLGPYLDDFQGTLWQNPEDTPSLIEKLLSAVSRGIITTDDTQLKTKLPQKDIPQPLPPPLPAAQPDMPSETGTINSRSTFYVERPTDQIALDAIHKKGVTIIIKASGQMGKSSLLFRTIKEAKNIGKRVVLIDFQFLDEYDLKDANTFFYKFCSLITQELKIEDKLDDYWKKSTNNIMRCTFYMEQHILREFGNSLVIAMDNVDSFFHSDFRSDFFRMLCGWDKTKRQTNPTIWQQLDLILVISVERFQLIEPPHPTFNIGELIELRDFTLEQVMDLNRLHNSCLTFEQIQEFMELVGGHPYLVYHGLYLVASHSLSASELFTKATEDTGPFGDHLGSHLFRLYTREDLIESLHKIISESTYPNERVLLHLRNAGLVRRDGLDVLPRCRLYAEYFRERLHV